MNDRDQKPILTSDGWEIYHGDQDGCEIQGCRHYEILDPSGLQCSVDVRSLPDKRVVRAASYAEGDDLYIYRLPDERYVRLVVRSETEVEEFDVDPDDPSPYLAALHWYVRTCLVLMPR